MDTKSQDKNTQVRNEKGVGVNKLTPQQREFIAEFGYFIQKYNVPEIARVFGVKRQTAQAHIDRKVKLRAKESK